MAENFHGARVKLRRAAKHLTELNRWPPRGDFYLLSVNQDAERRNWLTLFFDPEALPVDDAAVMIGDVLHNLRSALDILWNDIIIECGGEVTRHTRFPIRDTADALKGHLAESLKQKQIEIGVKDLLLSHIKPYKAGNYMIWALNDLNVRDKHKLLIPVVKIVHIRNVILKDENGKEFALDRLFADQPWTLPLRKLSGKKLRVKNQGYAATGIAFESGLPFAGMSVVPALDKIAKGVSRTVKAFETLLFGLGTS